MQSEKINFYTMSVLRPEESSMHVEDIVFLYRYLPLRTGLLSSIFLTAIPFYMKCDQEVLHSYLFKILSFIFSSFQPTG